MFESVEFPSDGATLRGRLYRSSEQPSPVVIMAHGTSAVVPMVLDRYAEVFARAGLSVLMYDHRGLGVSDGERQEVNPWLQARGYRDAVSFCSARSDLAGIGLWGVSFSAVECLVVGAIDERVAAVVVHVPTMGEAPAPHDDDGALFERLRARLLEGEVRGAERDRNGPMPVVSADQGNDPSLLPQRTAFDWFHASGDGQGWVNEVALVEPDLGVPWHAGLATPHLQCPVLISLARDDELPQADHRVVRAAFDAVPGPKRLLEFEGGHFSAFWHPSEAFDAVSDAHADFLVRVLVKKELP